MKKNRGFLALLMLPVLLLASGCAEENEEMLSEKPAVYLYPEKAEEVSVWLDYEGELTCTYPEYGDGWHVIARPDGTLQNLMKIMETEGMFLTVSEVIGKEGEAYVLGKHLKLERY